MSNPITVNYLKASADLTAKKEEWLRSIFGPTGEYADRFELEEHPVRMETEGLTVRFVQEVRVVRKCTAGCDDAFPATVDPDCPVHGH